MTVDLRLLDLVQAALSQAEEPAWSKLPEERREYVSAVAEDLALGALRCGVRPTLLDLSRTRAEREAWFAAGKRLEHERAQRWAAALASPGLSLDDEQAVSIARLRAFSAAADAVRGEPWSGAMGL